MTETDNLYESINKDWFYYNEQHDKNYYKEQRKMCDEFLMESRKEQHELLKEIEQLQLLIQQKQDRYTTLQMKKELIKDRIGRLNDEIQPNLAEKREKEDYQINN